MDRREFLGVLALSGLAGCAGAVAVRVTPSNGLLRLALADYPQLAGPAGALKLQPDGMANQIYVLVQPDGRFAAVSPICAHRGCTVNIEGAHLVCPCHGSTYDRAGGLLKGPAQRGLKTFRTEVRTGELVIHLESAP
jgi:cytochrome b6-f complex iron-sulfur subunit